MPKLHNSATKHASRQITIYRPYRRLLGHSKMPVNKQYWTIAGQCYNLGQVVSNSEYDHLKRGRLITMNQFRPVEREADVCAANRHIADVPTWYEEDFFTAMKWEDGRGNFNPGIINFDSYNQPKRGVAYYADIINYLVEREFDDVLVVGNFMFNEPRTKKRQFENPNAINEKLIVPNVHLREAIAMGWQISSNMFYYRAPENQTTMVSFYMWKKDLDMFN
jgi:hypothetical protein